ncbi:MAG: peptide-methionine (S)-S-oxide reductase MsrA, partial [Kiloniellales bacterium]
MAKATFAAGCFWGIEVAFRRLPGVTASRVGYTGGTTRNPSYQDVCTGRTGHAEAVEVTFDPSRIGYDDLLEEFWAVHDPTQLDRQGPDVGTQYRSAIFTHGPEQEAAARASTERLQAAGRVAGKVVTRIEPAVTFYQAEDYHQRYFEKQQRGRSAGR